MAGKRTIMVGTVGHGVLRSEDDGETWSGVPISKGMHAECLLRCMLPDPTRQEVIFAGTDRGLHRSDDAGASWTLLDTAMRGQVVWAFAIDPVDTNIMYAGTGTPSTPGIYRSTDRGKSWEQRPMDIAEECINVGVPRFTGIAVDPTNHRNIWAGIEVDGLRHSSDGGDTWTRAAVDLNKPDTHNVAVSATSPSTVFSVFNDEIFTSIDDGASWNPIGAREALRWPDRVYTRGIAIKPGDPEVIYLGIGNGTPGNTGAVYRSKDSGKTWENLPLPVEPNSFIYTVRIQEQDPSLVFAGSRYGYLYRSEDGGDSWSKMRREFGVISAIVWVPN